MPNILVVVFEVGIDCDGGTAGGWARAAGCVVVAIGGCWARAAGCVVVAIGGC